MLFVQPSRKMPRTSKRSRNARRSRPSLSSRCSRISSAVASYALEIKKSAAKELADLPSKELSRIVEKISSLAMSPRPSSAEKLSGDAKYRIRQGNYRVLYEVRDAAHKVTIVNVDHRRE